MGYPAGPRVMTPPTPSTSSRSRFSRLRPLTVPFRRVGRWFSHQPRFVRYGLALTVLAGLCAGGVYAWVYRQKRADERAVAGANREFAEAVRKTDPDAMRAALDRWAVASPTDATPGRYRAMLDRGEADPDAPQLAAVFLSLHLRADRLPEAAREGEKVLAAYPKDWQARCVVAHHALQVRRDPALAGGHLAKLPDPEDPEAHVSLGGVLYALRLSDAVGRDASGLRRAVLRKLVPLTRSAAAAGAEPGVKAQLLACYLEPFADPNALGELATFWAAADKLADDAVNEAAAAGDVPTLVRLAELGPRMRVALHALRARDPARLPPERFDPLLRAIDERQRRAWQAVREKAPDRPEAYHGLALLALQAGDPAGGVRVLLDGLAACGDRHELLELLVRLVARVGSADALRDLGDAVWRTADAAKTDPEKWCLAAEVALALNRAEAALAACRNARAVRADHRWACATEARIWVRAGKFFDAREALAPLGGAALLAPDLARLHARVLVGCGLWVVCDDEYKKFTDPAEKSKNNTPAVAFLLGVLDAPPDAERDAWVAARAELLLAAEPDAPLPAVVKAEALYRLADLSAAPDPKGAANPPVWNRDRVAAALKALEQLPLERRAEPDVIAAVAALKLKGERDAAGALRAAGGLLAAEATLAPGQLEILGAVLAANDRPADAVRVLERCARSPRPTAGCLVALSVAYHKNRQPDDARDALALAEQIAGRSDREQAELVAAKFLLQRETP